MELANGIDGLDSQRATVDGGLLEQYLRWSRRGDHRFLLLCLSVPVDDVDLFDNLMIVAMDFWERSQFENGFDNLAMTRSL